jgi:Tfp pilus assembly ATPase PilU
MEKQTLLLDKIKTNMVGVVMQSYLSRTEKKEKVFNVLYNAGVFPDYINDTIEKLGMKSINVEEVYDSFLIEYEVYTDEHGYELWVLGE